MLHADERWINEKEAYLEWDILLIFSEQKQETMEKAHLERDLLLYFVG